MRRRTVLSLPEARRLAVSATGLAGSASRDAGAGVRAGDVRRTVRRLGALQIDSVNVLARAHYLPLFARLGRYDTELLHGQAYGGRNRNLFEYWGHECSFLPVELYPAFRWRMNDAKAGKGIYRELVTFAREERALIKALLDRIEREGAATATELSADGKGTSGWWGWGKEKHALEYLIWTGELMTRARRGAGFARVYDVPEKCLPRAVLAAPEPTREEAHRELVLRAAKALGIAAEADLAAYYRLQRKAVKPAIDDLVAEGALQRVAVRGIDCPFVLDANARIPKQVAARALLAPFDPLVWDRGRAERLFDFYYRIEIYVPEPKRQYGYYVLPFVLGEKIVARVDMKADRHAGELLAKAVHLEAGAPRDVVAEQLAAELELMAAWLELDRVRVGGKAARSRDDAAKLTDDVRRLSNR